MFLKLECIDSLKIFKRFDNFGSKNRQIEKYNNLYTGMSLFSFNSS